MVVVHLAKGGVDEPTTPAAVPEASPLDEDEDGSQPQVTNTSAQRHSTVADPLFTSKVTGSAAFVRRRPEDDVAAAA
jgi:hypothetical protein